MFLIKKYRSTFSLLLFIFTSTVVLACEDGTGKVETVSLQKSTFLKHDADFNQYSLKQLATINGVAKNLNLENFKITSRDLSVSRSTQMADQFEVYFSVSLSFDPNEKALSAFVQSMNVSSASQYIYEDSCED